MTTPPEEHLVVCVNRRLTPASVSCAARGGEAIAEALEAALRARGLAHAVQRIHCFGRCQQGANVRLAPGGPFLHGVTPGQAEAVVARLLAWLRERGNRA